MPHQSNGWLRVPGWGLTAQALLCLKYYSELQKGGSSKWMLRAKPRS
jgi:hypothetical protein